MPKFLCMACGVQYPESPIPPSRCIICEDPRQFVPKTGQGWTTREKLAVDHFNAFRKIAPELFALSTLPRFGIGQRAFLIITPSGNVLWDCISFLDSSTVEIIRLLGGIKAIAISHPHFYSAMEPSSAQYSFTKPTGNGWLNLTHASSFGPVNRRRFLLESLFTGSAATFLEALFCIGLAGRPCSLVIRYWWRRMKDT
jgi:hypothetical protein